MSKISHTKNYNHYRQLTLQDKRSSKLNFNIDNRFYYVYRITNIKLNKHYYGSRATTLNPEDDLGIKYFSSSKDKEFKQDQKDNPQNYKYKVIKTFNNSAESQIFESYLHQYFDVKLHESFYNKANQRPFGYDRTGIPTSKLQKQKASETHKGKKPSKEIADKISKTRNEWSEERKEEYSRKQRESHIGKKLSKNHKNNIKAAHYRRSEEEENKRRLKISKTILSKSKEEMNDRALKQRYTRREMVLIITSYNIVKHITYTQGWLKELCINKNYPISAFNSSLKNKGQLLYNNERGYKYVKNKYNEQFRFWWIINVKDLKFSETLSGFKFKIL